MCINLSIIDTLNILYVINTSKLDLIIIVMAKIENLKKIKIFALFSFPQISFIFNMVINLIGYRDIEINVNLIFIFRINSVKNYKSEKKYINLFINL